MYYKKAYMEYGKNTNTNKQIQFIFSLNNYLYFWQWQLFYSGRENAYFDFGSSKVWDV